MSLLEVQVRSKAEICVWRERALKTLGTPQPRPCERYGGCLAIVFSVLLTFQNASRPPKLPRPSSPKSFLKGSSHGVYTFGANKSPKSSSIAISTQDPSAPEELAEIVLAIAFSGHNHNRSI